MLFILYISQSYCRDSSNLDDLLSLTESIGDESSGDGPSSFNKFTRASSSRSHDGHYGGGYVSGAVSRLPVNTMRKASSGIGGGMSKEVLLGGSDCSLGPDPSKFRKIVNDQLLCLKCMCEVVRFADYKWDHSVDYMFFRNFWPEPERLRTKMLKCHSYAAYCCQCCWYSAKGVEHLPATLRWSAQ